MSVCVSVCVCKEFKGTVKECEEQKGSIENRRGNGNSRAESWCAAAGAVLFNSTEIKSFCGLRWITTLKIAVYQRWMEHYFHHSISDFYQNTHHHQKILSEKQKVKHSVKEKSIKGLLKWNAMKRKKDSTHRFLAGAAAALVIKWKPQQRERREGIHVKEKTVRHESRLVSAAAAAVGCRSAQLRQLSH